MPLLQLHTSVDIPAEQRNALLRSLSKIVAEVVGKPETYVMVTLREGPICMSGEVEPAAFVDVRSIGGLSADTNRHLSERICALLGEELGISGNRVYLNFVDVQRVNWGWDSRTFG